MASRLLGRILFLTCAVVLSADSAAHADFGGTGDSRHQTFDVTGGVYQRAGGHGANGSGSDYKYKLSLTARCDQDDREIGACREGLLDCPGSPPDDELNQWRLTRVEVVDAAGQPVTTYQECLNYVVLLGKVTAEMVRAQMVRRVPQTVFTLSPDTRGTVRLPEIVAVTGQQQLDFPLVIIGQAVTLRINAERYDWTFGDGGILSTDAPGMPYSDAASCRREDDCGAYVHHTYESGGQYPIQVTISWHGQFSVGGGAFVDIPERVAVPSAPVVLPVAEVQVVTGR